MKDAHSRRQGILMIQRTFLHKINVMGVLNYSFKEPISGGWFNGIKAITMASARL
jgi:hypothetical protein